VRQHVLSLTEDYFSKAIILPETHPEKVLTTFPSHILPWKYFGSPLPGIKPEEHPNQDDLPFLTCQRLFLKNSPRPFPKREFVHTCSPRPKITSQSNPPHMKT
jgi:hypothetical protein